MTAYMVPSVIEHYVSAKKKACKHLPASLKGKVSPYCEVLHPKLCSLFYRLSAAIKSCAISVKNIVWMNGKQS